MKAGRLEIGIGDWHLRVRDGDLSALSTVGRPRHGTAPQWLISLFAATLYSHTLIMIHVI
jgi:hypothetical protein